MLTNHPNAEVSVYTGAATVILVFILGSQGVAIGAEVGAAITTVLTGFVLLLGRRSVKHA